MRSTRSASPRSLVLRRPKRVPAACSRGRFLRYLLSVEDERRSGWTLGHLLAVAVIAVAVPALLVPALGLAFFGDGAVRARMSSLRQTGAACLVYTIDYDDRLPYPSSRTSPNDACSTGATWKQKVLPYLVSKASLLEATDPSAIDCPADAPLRRLGRFGANVYWADRTPTALVELHRFQIPSATFLLGRNTDGRWSVAPAVGFCPGAVRVNGPGVVRFDRQKGGLWVYADGHADWLSVQETYDRDCARWKLAKPSSYFE